MLIHDRNDDPGYPVQIEAQMTVPVVPIPMNREYQREFQRPDNEFQRRLSHKANYRHFVKWFIGAFHNLQRNLPMG